MGTFQHNKVRINEQGILVFEYSELIPGYISDSNFKQLKLRGQLEASRACKGRPAEIVFESLPERYKQAVLAKYPDPYLAAANQQLLDLYLQPDVEARAFFESFTWEGGQRMDIDMQVQLIRIATWLNLSVSLKHKLPQLPNDLRKQLTKDHWALFFKVLELQREPVKIPNSYTRLMRKIDEYYDKARGVRNYDILIHRGHGQRNAAKIVTEEQQNCILGICTHHNNLYDTQVMQLYNAKAEKLGWPTISETTVRNWRKEYGYLVDPAAKGKQVYRNTQRAQVRRERPSKAGMFWGVDGHRVELLFQNRTTDKQGRTKVDYNAHLELIAVVDAFNDHIVGYHIGKEDTTTIRKAVKNAVDYVYSKTGKYYLINELQSDNFQIANLKPFYQAAAVFHRETTVGNAKDKPIEPFFKRFNDFVKMHANNWSGYGIASRKESQPNFELVQQHRHQFPTVQEGFDQIRALVEGQRAGTEAKWLESFNALIAEGRAVEISLETYLNIFGETTGHTNTYTAGGLDVTIQGQKYTYDLLLPEFREMMWCNWIVKFDAANLQQVLVISEETGHTFLLTKKHKIHMAAMEMTDEDRHELNRINGYNKHHESRLNRRMEEIGQTMDELMPEFSHMRLLKTKPVIKGQQKKLLQELNNVVDIEEIEETPKRSRLDSIDWGAKALEDL